MLLPIVFLSQTENSINLFLNSFSVQEYKDYKSLHYYLKDRPETEQIINVLSQNLTIHNLKSGIYVFYLSNGADKTDDQEIYITGESNKKIVNRLIDYITDNEYEDFIQKECFRKYELSRTKGKSFTEIVAENYRNTTDPMDWETETYAQILFVTERYENVFLINSNKELCDKIKIIYQPVFRLGVPGWITHAIVINKETGIYKKILFNNDNPDGEIPMAPDELYEIELYADNDLVTKMIHYQPDEKICAYIREEHLQLDNLDTAILADINLNDLEIEMTDEEKNRIAEEKTAAVRNWLTYRPILKAKGNGIHIEVSVGNMDLLEVFGKQFYVSAKDEDLFMDKKVCNRIPFNNNPETYNLYVEGVSDKAVFDLRDGSGNIISKYARQNPDLPDIEDKKLKLECYEYQKELMTALSPALNDTNLKNVINNELRQTADTDGSSPVTMLHDILLFLASQEGMEVSRGKLYVGITNNWLSQFDIDEKFFYTQTIAYYNSVSSIRFPVRKTDYVLVRAGWNTNDDSVHMDYKLSSPDRNTEFETNKYDFNVFYCISTDNYVRSGFVYVSNLTGEKAMVSNVFSIEEGLKDG